jgi:KipI family sensor histidine kinase inhibitor
MSVATDLRVLDYGDHALLLECESTADVLAWADALRQEDLTGVTDILPASRTVMVKVDGARFLPVIRQRIQKLRVVPGDDVVGDSIDITLDVVYDGADLDEVGHITGLGAEGVVTAHTAAPWRVAFGGFAPGFAYLVGGDERLHVPRRAEPRVHVPVGSVGLAGEFSGVYPRETPGGWQLIGRTDVVLWDVERDPPALLLPGSWVQFRAIG